MTHSLQQNSSNAPSFYGLGIAPRILDILENIKFKVPTPIQLQVIPLVIEGSDVVGIAQTGTGKTHSFAIPMVQCLAGKKGIGLVLAPTRELAIQINEAFQEIVPSFKMEAVCLIGGAPMEPQVTALRRNPRIIIATPGRLIDHMSNWNVLPQEVAMLVLDEADRMLDMGFLPQIELILQHLPKERQTMLFSATMPKEIMGIAEKYMQLPVSVEIAPSGTTADNVTQELYIVKKSDKTRLLRQVLSQYHGPVLLFSRTKHNSARLARAVRDMGHSAAEIHSNRSLEQRGEALEGFKSGKYKVLVATDIASRGIDVTGIELVINYDIPEDPSNYVHRIGRTGRAGHKGHAISFAMPEQSKDVKNIEELIKTTLPISKHPEVSSEKFIQVSTPELNKKAKGKFRRYRPRGPRK
ncbi:MAG: DEAD/DEAH box helicase [Candidatus Omnitrophica bacterium]|nr:DEAD/DEAH box helicase [Candidatus Omnitrophota bacterium]